MRAVTIIDGALEWAEHPDPVPGNGEALVKVHAAGINSGDRLQVMGFYPAPPGSPPDIPGLELAGEVIALGSGASRFQLGDRVMAVVGGGAQAELCVVHERHLIGVPDGVSWEAAGGFPEAFTTAYDALFSQADLALGERLCVHGAAGGVGIAGVQLGVQAGAEVIATVRNESLRDRVASFGATVVAPEDFGEHGPFDVILELIGGPNIPTDITSLQTGGRIAVIGTGAGVKAELNLLDLMLKRARIHGSTLRARSLEEKAVAARAVETHVVPLFADGRLTVPVDSTFSMADAGSAYDYFKAGGKLGKIILVP
ncbi:MAG: zinc-binding dehydrogenase [Actinobacteria bacterium]|nr:zinc-binding dehydrogenase [Actinomycetota bacterium]MCB9390138.1 zinc-binding dehydrogenase [Acidimicrobiia bacterium]